MNSIHRAEDGEGQRWALKLVGPAAEDRRLAGIRLEKEAVILRENRAVPGIPAFHSFEKGILAMEWIPGDTLLVLAEQARSQGHPLDWPRNVAGWIAALASTLHQLHRNGVVHRDIKPANVLLRSEGDPTLIDFGVAVAGSNRRSLPHPWREQAVGTRGYRAPELIADPERAVKPAVDVFGLSATAYALLALAPPPLRVMDVEETPLGALIRKGLSANPEDRPPIEMFAALEPNGPYSGRID